MSWFHTCFSLCRRCSASPTMLKGEVLLPCITTSPLLLSPPLLTFFVSSYPFSWHLVAFASSFCSLALLPVFGYLCFFCFYFHTLLLLLPLPHIHSSASLFSHLAPLLFPPAPMFSSPTSAATFSGLHALFYCTDSSEDFTNISCGLSKGTDYTKPWFPWKTQTLPWPAYEKHMVLRGFLRQTIIKQLLSESGSNFPALVGVSSTMVAFLLSLVACWVNQLPHRHYQQGWYEEEVGG